MKHTNTPWEESQNQYRLLLEAVNDLIKNTTLLAGTYESTNMDFAHLIYENGLYELMQRAEQLKTYERGFELMHYSMQGHVKQLRRLREGLQLFLIKDPVNIPKN
ncbi:hypothetical protein GCM10009122_55560 [Fulvivirga kasyanovii]|uniref:Uncharacterized protein n=1 Tax=Fulvivirga kasyanovii TaxID=396812 RepID=A0ABW9RH80_9BACT|nr:hypothetical protein [Fulvivirga kasyanovii]MTI23423.1 hypothetical protein [Fulvivirga kasyanovii]